MVKLMIFSLHGLPKEPVLESNRRSKIPSKITENSDFRTHVTKHSNLLAKGLEESLQTERAFCIPSHVIKARRLVCSGWCEPSWDSCLSFCLIFISCSCLQWILVRCHPLQRCPPRKVLLRLVYVVFTQSRNPPHKSLEAAAIIIILVFQYAHTLTNFSLFVEWYA